MKKLSIENYHELQAYINLAHYPECNSNTMTLLMWSNQYEVYYECYEDFALVYSQTFHHSGVWLMPYCLKENRKKAILQMEKRSQELGIDFHIYSMTKEFKTWLQESFPQSFFAWNCYDAADYIYDRKQQETLIGKKMQKRRNHFTAFLKQYENRYVFKPLEKKDHKEVLAFLERWKLRKDPSEYATIDVEKEGIKLFLDHWDDLPILGSCIYVDGALEAFNIASYLKEDMIQIHVEKANKDIRGLYIAILKLFLETLPSEVIYVNREDDMGLPELRKNKSDMCPIYKEKKFACRKDAYHIHQATASWKQKIHDLWLARFQEETQASTDFYFDHYYDEEHTWILTHQEDLISMVQLRPMDVSINKNQEKTYFIVGVATNPDYEGCGYMDLLLNEVFSKDPYQQVPFLCLQAYNWDLYKHLGFEQTYQQRFYRLDHSAYQQEVGTLVMQADPALLSSLYHMYMQDKTGYRIRTEDYYQTLFIPYSTLWNLTIETYYEQQEAKGYVVYEVQGKECIVQELICTTKQAKDAMLSTLCARYEKLRVYTAIDEELQGKEKLVTNMAIRNQSRKPFPTKHLFIHESI